MIRYALEIKTDHADVANEAVQQTQCRQTLEIAAAAHDGAGDKTAIGPPPYLPRRNGVYFQSTTGEHIGQSGQVVIDAVGGFERSVGAL